MKRNIGNLMEDDFYCESVFRDVFTQMENIYWERTVVPIYESEENDFYEESNYLNHFISFCFEV